MAVEVLFHLVPLTLLVLLLRAVLGVYEHPAGVWGSLAVVSLIEPVYQIRLIAGDGGYPSWLLVYLGIHLTAFNLMQLGLFRRYDFLSMYGARLVYYLIWHIVWGHLRLQLVL
jgi:hypothetical protein